MLLPPFLLITSVYQKSFHILYTNFYPCVAPGLTGFAGSGTTTVSTIVAVRFVPSVVVAVIVTTPGAKAVTLPLASTVATAGLSEVKVNVFSVVVAGVITGTSDRELPTINVGAGAVKESAFAFCFTTI